MSLAPVRPPRMHACAPERVRPADLHIDEPPRWLPRLDPSPPPHRHPVQLQSGLDQRPDSHLDRSRCRHLESQPRRRDPLEVVGIAVEGEDQSGRKRNALLPLKYMDAGHPRRVGTHGSRAMAASLYEHGEGAGHLHQTNRRQPRRFQPLATLG